MSRLFDSSSDNLRNTSYGGGSSAAGTIALMIRPNWNSGDGVTHVFFQYGNNTDIDYEAPSFQKFSDNNVYIGFNGNGLGDQRIAVSDSGLFSNGVWALHMLTWSDADNDERYYVDGTEAGSRTSALSTFSGTAISIGNYDASFIPQQNANARIAEFGRWNRVLSSGERAQVLAAKSPRVVPIGLIEYYPLIGRWSPEVSFVNAVTLTVSNADQAEHPPVRYPRRHVIGRRTAAALRRFVLHG